MDVRPWIDEASAALKAKDYETAARIAQSIVEAGHSSGYELLAHAERGRGDYDRAIEVLEEGVREAPPVWLLWQLLANTCSDVGSDEMEFKGRLLRMRVLNDLGRHPEAVSEGERAAEVVPETAAAAELGDPKKWWQVWR